MRRRAIRYNLFLFFFGPPNTAQARKKIKKGFSLLSLTQGGLEPKGSFVKN
jgi:hypothetical protein